MSISLDNTQQALTKFSNDLIAKAKNNLKSKNASSKLSNSLNYDLKVHPNSFSLKVNAEDYWEYVNYGVKGVGGTKADGSKWKLKKVTNSKFKYKTKRPPTSAFNLWSVTKGLAPRNNKGQFTSRKSLMFAISESVYRTGLETTNFITDPFEKEYKELPDELVEAYSLDLDEFIKYVL